MIGNTRCGFCKRGMIGITQAAKRRREPFIACVACVARARAHVCAGVCVCVCVCVCCSCFLKCVCVCACAHVWVWVFAFACRGCNRIFVFVARVKCGQWKCGLLHECWCCARVRVFLCGFVCLLFVFAEFGFWVALRRELLCLLFDSLCVVGLDARHHGRCDFNCCFVSSHALFVVWSCDRFCLRVGFWNMCFVRNSALICIVASWRSAFVIAVVKIRIGFNFAFWNVCICVGCMWCMSSRFLMWQHRTFVLCCVHCVDGFCAWTDCVSC